MDKEEQEKVISALNGVEEYYLSDKFEEMVRKNKIYRAGLYSIILFILVIALLLVMIKASILGISLLR